MVKHAIILAGGKGERLRPYTDDRPKVMVEVAGKPIIKWQIEWLKSHGIEKFVIAGGYKAGVIQDYLKDGSELGVEIVYSIEDSPLGTGGAIKKALRHEVLSGVEDFIVTNGDIITQFDLSKMIEKYLEKQILASILLVPYLSRWGVVKVDDQDQILGFEEKPNLPYWINGGIFVFNKEIDNLLPENGNYEKETFPKIPKEQFFGFKDDSFWRAVDVVKDKTEAEEYLLRAG